MLIQPTNQNIIGNYKPNFMSNCRLVYDAASRSKDLLYRNNSCFYRDDLNWEKLIKTLEEKYKDASKVNIYCFGCSEGAEPISLAMLLMEKLGVEKSNKFFPIMASDIDSEILKNPTQGIITISKDDVKEIQKFLGESHSKYLEFDSTFKENKFLNEEVSIGKIKPVLKNKITYKQAEIQNSIQNIIPDNSVVLCRNFWPYIKDYQEQKTIINKLFKQLGNNSLCIIGDFDGYDTEMCFFDSGFKSDLNRFWFNKISNEKKFTSNPHYLFNIFANKAS